MLRRLIICTVAALLLGYAGSYAVLSVTGGWVVSESGEVRILSPLAAGDIFLWQPRYGQGQWFRHYGGEHSFRGDSLGEFYAPLILLDQRFFHRTIRWLRKDGTLVEPIPAPPLSEYHPLWMNRFYGCWPYGLPEPDTDAPRACGGACPNSAPPRGAGSAPATQGEDAGSTSQER